MRIDYGSRVYILAPDGSDFLVRVEKNHRFTTHLGTIDMDDLIGLEYGSSVETSKGKRVYLLEPGIVQNVFKMKRQTQIVYPKDMGFILLMLDVKQGDRVIEAGVGSGAMTGALARAVGEKGRVYAYERREDFYELALSNLRRWALTDRVKLKLRDISEGFDERNVDSVFLDVPDPWNYMNHAWKSLKGGGRVAIVCPTTNQVQEVLKSIEESDFTGVEVWESLFRRYKTNPERLRPFDRMVAHTTYMIFAIKTL